MRPVALALEMADEHNNVLSTRNGDHVLRAVSAEDSSLAVGVIDVGADSRDLVLRFRQQPDVDATVVVSVDQHHVGVRDALDRLQQDRGELVQRDPIIGLNNGEEISADLTHHHRDVPRRELINRLRLHLHPANPISATVRNDVQTGSVCDLAPHERTSTVLTQLGVSTSIVSLRDPEPSQQLPDLRLILLRVDRLVQKRVDPCICLERWATLLLVAVVRAIVPLEQVLDVVVRDPHVSCRD
jgi:hypothetical protein